MWSRAKSRNAPGSTTEHVRPTPASAAGAPRRCERSEPHVRPSAASIVRPDSRTLSAPDVPWLRRSPTSFSPVWDPQPDFRGRSCRVPDVPRAHAHHRIHYLDLGDRPESSARSRPRDPWCTKNLQSLLVRRLTPELSCGRISKMRAKRGPLNRPSGAAHVRHHAEGCLAGSAQ